MPASLSRLIPGIVGDAYRRRGFTEPALVTGWRAIVGEETAARTVPVKVGFPRGSRTGGTLHVRVEGAYATELQHNAPRIVERINSFYGYAAIARLALHQGPVEAVGTGCAPAKPAVKGAPAVDGSAIDGPAVDGIESPRLRNVLLGLGMAIRADSAHDPE